MLSFTQNKKKYLIIGLVLVFVLFAAYVLIYPKFAKSASKIEKNQSTDTIPMMRTDDVVTLISDSGLIRYKMIAETWLVYDRVKDPYWLFPDKFYVEQFDTLFAVVATIKADTAWNYYKKKLWKLRGNVDVQNLEGDRYTSEELFWDERRKKIYSDKYVEIHQPGKMTLRVIEGFEANEQMTEYTFKKLINADLYVNEADNSEKIDTENR